MSLFAPRGDCLRVLLLGHREEKMCVELVGWREGHLRVFQNTCDCLGCNLCQSWNQGAERPSWFKNGEEYEKRVKYEGWLPIMYI